MMMMIFIGPWLSAIIQSMGNRHRREPKVASANGTPPPANGLQRLKWATAGIHRSIDGDLMVPEELVTDVYDTVTADQVFFFNGAQIVWYNHNVHQPVPVKYIWIKNPTHFVRYE